MLYRLFLVAICLAGVVALSIFVLSKDIDWDSAQVQQGSIAALVVILGWLVTFVFKEGSTAFDRLDMSRDVLAALSVEISDFRDTLSLSQDDANRYSEELENLTLSQKSDEPAYFPFFASIAPVLVANRFSGELRALPHSCVEPIVQFYATYADLQVMLEDTRSEAFKELPAQRRLVLYQDYIGTRLMLGDLAESAIGAINAALSSGMLGLQTRLQKFSVGRALGTRKHHD